MAKSENIFHNLLLVFCGIIIAFVIAEISLRALDIPRSWQAHSSCRQFGFVENKNGYIHWRNAPSAAIRFIYDGNPRGYFGTGNEVDHHTNSWGFRGREFYAMKPDKTYRIAFLGDSYTFGEGVKDSDTYAEQTAVRLARKLNFPAGKIESYNFGVGGYSFVHEWFLLNELVLKMKPDAVVFKIDIADFETPMFQLDPLTGHTERAYRGPAIEQPSFNASSEGWLLESRVFKLVGQTLQTLAQTRKVMAYYNWLMTDANPGWRVNLEALHAALRTCREKNIPCYVLCFPISPQRDAHKIIRSEVEKEGGVFIDLVRQKGYRHSVVHPADGHPNETVHAFAAQLLANKMAAELPISVH